jgi:hypothetical protein
MARDGNSDTDGPEEVAVERLPPDEAFGLLGHEIRFGILEALNDADEPLSFSELREAVDVRDPGQFNYHLGELDGRFVRKRGEEYHLAAAGNRVVGAVLSGGITKGMAGDAVPSDARCIECGESMVARFRQDGIAVECPACGMQYTDPDVPAGVLEGRPEADVATTVDRWLLRNQMSAQFGFCIYCDGPVEQRVHLPGEAGAPDWFVEEAAEADVVVTFECGRCGEWWHAAAALAVLTHPAAVGFHYEQGIDLRETPSWELPWFEPPISTLAGEDPLRFEVPMELEGERYVPTFNRDLTVVEERRESVDT